MKHIVTVTYSDPGHEFISLRGRTQSTNYVVEARDIPEAQNRASSYFRSMGYKVHSAVVNEQKVEDTPVVIKEEAEQIEDRTDREIAELLHRQQAEDERRAYLHRLGELAKASPDITAARDYSDRVARAYERAVVVGNFSALEALDRELKRAMEEEEFLMTATLMLILASSCPVIY